MAEDKKPTVFPTQEQINNGKIEERVTVQESPLTSEAEKQAAKEMYDKTQEQIQKREEMLKAATDSALQNEAYREDILKRAEEEKIARDTRLDNQYNVPNLPPQPPLPPTPPSNSPTEDGASKLPEGYVKELMEPQWDAPYDMIPLPSEGKLYKNVKSNVRIAYLNASDENLLSSPHILDSDQFMEILINRKILEPNLRYSDLHVGDRNAIMIWLRATAYGTEYPITVLDNDGKPFDYDFDLRELKTKKLKAEPDEEGLFTFKFPTNGDVVKFKFLTMHEVDELEAKLAYEEDVLKLPLNNSITYTLGKHIVQINGESDDEKIKTRVGYMRTIDREALMEYINEIESGLDLEISIPTPSGEPVTTLLPLNFNFFWPNNRI